MFSTQYNYIPSLADGETNEGISETIPGQSLSIKEILIKFSNGTLPQISKNAIYDEDPSFDNINPTYNGAFDLADYTNGMDNIRANRKAAVKANQVNSSSNEDKQLEPSASEDPAN